MSAPDGLGGDLRRGCGAARARPQSVRA